MPEDEDFDTGATVREGVGNPQRKDEYLAAGTEVGRYVVSERLGEGGMGVVYAATDPELDRKVAIKLLQTRRNDDREQAWLTREAQALARLSHPNVVAVYDVGTLPGDRVFIAMEHVEGETLRRWTRTHPPWREVIAALRGAGEGLAAAHAVGLVHRDFKPDNAIVGRDRRVRVMDFGLARLKPEAGSEPPRRDSDLSIEAKSPLSASLTVAGEVFGTPAYMAPELYEGHPADARTDQFSFGVTLYEALFHKRPYQREVLAKVPRIAPLVPAPPPPSEVPPAIVRAVMRAIAPRPEDRFASMDELLAALVEPPRRRAPLLVAGFALVAVAAGGAVYVRSGSGPPACDGIALDVDRSKIAAAFAATKLPYAERAAKSVANGLDAYAGEWLAAATQSCRATRIEKTQTDEVAALRQACLDQDREELAALVGLLAQADAGLVDRADKAIAQLPPVARCANIVALLAPDRPPPELIAKLAPVLRAVATANAQSFAGRGDAALATIEPQLAQALSLGFAPAIAQAQYAKALALAVTAKTEPAIAAFADAAWAAIRGKRDDIASEAAMFAARLTAEGTAKPGEAKIWLGLAGAAVARVHDRVLDEELLEAQGIVAASAGDLKGAIAAHEAALKAAEAMHGPADPTLWRTLYTIASTLAKAHAYADATPYFQRALALRSEGAGGEHPDIALILTSLGACYDHGGEPAKARAAFERALAIREKTFGPDSPRLIATLNNTADLLLQQRDFAAALTAIRRARAIAEKTPGTAHPLYHTVLTTQGEAEQAAGDFAAARVSLDEAIALETKSSSPMLATTLVSRGELAVATKQWKDALAISDRAIAALEQQGAAAELWRPLAQRATAKHALKQDARADADRALKIAIDAKLPEADTARLRALRATLPP